MNRRQILRTIGGGFAGWAAMAQGRPPRLLLRSSWQVVNIGDIAHTPGVLALLERHIPDAEVRLWPSSVANGVEAMLRRRFPRLQIVSGESDIAAAFAQCDFLLHGSGPSLVAERDVARWRRDTGKPYGVYGITLNGQSVNPQVVDLLNGARFAYFRDSRSLQFAQQHGLTNPVAEFGPDGAFATDLRNDAAAREFLAAHRLEPGRFLCCIPRYRFTPYWSIPGSTRPYDADRDRRNQAMKEHDHAPLRAAITALVRDLRVKILICAEDETQVALGKDILFDPLPADVKAATVWRDRFWLTDEALSIYRQAAGLFGNEMHSPIMCVGNGIPALVCRFEEQTSKGFMWRDIGLGDWLFDLDNERDVSRILPAVLAMAKDPAAARRKVRAAQEFVRKRQRDTMATLRRELDKAQA